MYFNDSFQLIEHYKTIAAQTPIWFHIIVGVVLLLGALSSMFTNGLVLIVFIKNRKLLTRINSYIVAICSLAIIMAVFGVPLVIVSCFRYFWFWGEIGCRYYAFLTSFCGLATMLLLTAISVDRYIFVVRNNLSARLPKAFNTVMMCVCLGVALVFALCPLFGWNQFVYEGVGTACAIDLIGEGNNGRSFVVTLVVTCFLIPVSIMIFSYGSVYAKVIKDTKVHMRSANANNATIKKLKLEHKLAVTIILIIGCFLLCWSPYACLLLWKMVNRDKEIPAMLMTVPSMLTKVGGVFTPFVYVTKNKNFRKQALSVLRCKKSNTSVNPRVLPQVTPPSKIFNNALPSRNEGSRSNCYDITTV